MPPLWSRELKWAVVASLMVHGAALAWLPVQAVAPPAAPPPLEVRLLAQVSAPVRLPAPANPPITATAARAASLQRDAPALAEPAAEAALPALLPAPPAILRSAHDTVSLAAAPSTSAADGATQPTEPESASTAMGKAVAPAGVLRQAGPAGAMPAAGPLASAPAPAEAADGALAARVPAQAAIAAEARRAGALEALAGPARPVTASGDTLASVAEVAAGQYLSQAHQRDKTPWAAALPVAAPAQPQVLRTPEPAIVAEPASEPRAQTAEVAPPPGTLRAAVANTLSLLEAEEAPSSAIALARLNPHSHACYAPPPAQWNAQGRVVLRVRVDATGRPETVTLDSGSGEPRLDRLAIEQTRSCARFDIVDRQGRPRAATVRLPVIYKFSD